MHRLFNGVNITQSGDFYNFTSYLETILTYGSDASLSPLTNSYWYKGTGNMLPCDPTKTYDDNTNTGFIARWNRQKQSKEIEMYGRVHSDICNVPKFILPGVRIQFTKAKQDICLMSGTPDSKTISDFSLPGCT